MGLYDLSAEEMPGAVANVICWDAGCHGTERLLAASDFLQGEVRTKDLITIVCVCDKTQACISVTCLDPSSGHKILKSENWPQNQKLRGGIPPY